MKVNPMQVCCVVFICLPFALSMTLISNGDANSDANHVVTNDDDDDGDVCKKDLSDMFLNLLSGPARKETEALLVRLITILDGSTTNTDGGKDDHGYHSAVIKRIKPSFNPTGWRRKRDIGRNAAFEQMLLHAYGYLGEPLSGQDGGSNQQWRKRNTYTGIPQKRFNDGSSKRKPLEFNPTGW